MNWNILTAQYPVGDDRIVTNVERGLNGTGQFEQ
jgi:hypothetical protein